VQNAARLTVPAHHAGLMASGRKASRFFIDPPLAGRTEGIDKEEGLVGVSDRR
jgi:hypothetical protein